MSIDDNYDDVISLVKVFHGIPRFGHTDNFAHLLTKQKRSDYILSVWFISGFLLVFFLLWMTIILIFKCLGASKVGTLSGNPQSWEHKSKKHKLWTRIFFSSCFVGVIVSMILYVSLGYSSIEQAFDIFNNELDNMKHLTMETGRLLKEVIQISEETVPYRDHIVNITSGGICTKSNVILDALQSSINGTVASINATNVTQNSSGNNIDIATILNDLPEGVDPNVIKDLLGVGDGKYDFNLTNIISQEQSLLEFLGDKEQSLNGFLGNKEPKMISSDLQHQNIKSSKLGNIDEITNTMVNKMTQLGDFALSNLRSWYTYFLDVVLPFYNKLDRYLNQVRGYSKWTFYVTIPIGAMSVVTMIVTLLVWKGIRNRCIIIFQKWVVMPLFILTTVICIVVFFVYGVFAVVNADICHGPLQIGNPAATVISIMEEKNIKLGALTSSALEYYITSDCKSLDPLSFVKDFQGYLIEAAGGVEALGNSIDSTKTSLEAYCETSLTPLLLSLRGIEGTLIGLSGITNQALAISTCEDINSIYRNVVHSSLCDKTITGCAWMFFSTTAICFFAMIMITVRSICYPVVKVDVAKVMNTTDDDDDSAWDVECSTSMRLLNDQGTQNEYRAVPRLSEIGSYDDATENSQLPGFLISGSKQDDKNYEDDPHKIDSHEDSAWDLENSTSMRLLNDQGTKNEDRALPRLSKVGGYDNVTEDSEIAGFLIPTSNQVTKKSDTSSRDYKFYEDDPDEIVSLVSSIDSGKLSDFQEERCISKELLEDHQEMDDDKIDDLSSLGSSADNDDSAKSYGVSKHGVDNLNENENKGTDPFQWEYGNVKHNSANASSIASNEDSDFSPVPQYPHTSSTKAYESGGDDIDSNKYDYNGESESSYSIPVDEPYFHQNPSVGNINDFQSVEPQFTSGHISCVEMPEQHKNRDKSEKNEEIKNDKRKSFQNDYSRKADHYSSVKSLSSGSTPVMTNRTDGLSNKKDRRDSVISVKKSARYRSSSVDLVSNNPVNHTSRNNQRRNSSRDENKIFSWLDSFITTPDED